MFKVFSVMEGREGENDGRGAISRGHWRPEEDQLLRNLVERFGPKNWNTIAEGIEGRTGKSCRLRWFNQLDPNLNKLPFTEEEETRLILAQRAHGNKWSAIARHFPGRTDNAVKNHFHVIMSRKRKDPNLSLPSFAPTLGGGYNIGAPGGPSGMIYEPTFPRYAGSNSFTSGIQTPYPFNFGDIDGSNLICAAPVALDGNAAHSNINAGAAGGPFGYSGFGFVPGMVGDSSKATNINVAQNEDANPPFIDFLGVESKNPADH